MVEDCEDGIFLGFDHLKLMAWKLLKGVVLFFYVLVGIEPIGIVVLLSEGDGLWKNSHISCMLQGFGFYTWVGGFGLDLEAKMIKKNDWFIWLKKEITRYLIAYLPSWTIKMEMEKGFHNFQSSNDYFLFEWEFLYFKFQVSIGFEMLGSSDKWHFD